MINCISGCSSSLQIWNKTKFGKVHEKLKEATEKLVAVQKLDPAVLNPNEMKEASEEVNKWMDREEIMWK